MTTPTTPTPTPTLPMPMQQGRNISGRPWKVVGRPSISKVSQGNGAVIGWQKREKERQRMRVIRDFERELKGMKREKEEREKKERKERKERKEKRERESVIGVRVSDAKVRRMKRKNLKLITKNS